MKRPHRRIHLLLWGLLTPVTLVAGFYFWSLRPASPIEEPVAIFGSEDIQGQ